MPHGVNSGKAKSRADSVVFSAERNGVRRIAPPVVMAGLDPAIHVFLPLIKQERGCPAQGRA
jgi:hypothetical protein